ncbi:MAG: hypothetical protein DME26_19075 [Verrucomicrobia bacterium]|nr:MAG: hypothetical protein DME26_19075 [Verrucomicrobiota bacterium]
MIFNALPDLRHCFVANISTRTFAHAAKENSYCIFALRLGELSFCIMLKLKVLSLVSKTVTHKFS